jgi:hypothetical protein
MDRHLFHTKEQDGFTVEFYALPEDLDPRDIFDPEIEAEFDTFGKIERGELEWFCVQCVASKDGIALGSDFLGGCCYASFEDFLEPQFKITERDGSKHLRGYAEDMASEAVSQAKAQLARLCA